MPANGSLAERLHRKFRELRPHVPQRSAALDDLCAVAVAATGCVDARITLSDADKHIVLGGSNPDATSFPRMFDAGLTEQFYERHHLDRNPEFVRMLEQFGNGTPVRSFLVTPISMDGQTVGFFGLASTQSEGAFSQLDRALLFRLARVAEGMVRSEIALSRVVNQAMAAIADNGR